MGCCKSSGWGLLVAVGVAGVTAGVVGSRAMQGADPAPEPALDPALALVSFLQPEEMSMDQMLEMMKDWAAPVEEHEVLKSMEGTWDCTTKFWMGPGEPMTGTGVSENQIILGGRYATQHFTMPDMMGMPFEGYGAVGYDKAKQKYVTIWIDNFSTGFMHMDGEYDEDAKTMTWTGNSVYPDGQGGTIEVPTKHIVRHESKDKTVMEFWEPMGEGGEMTKTGEITYNRRK